LERRAEITVELATASYKSFIPAMGVPVATSSGRPKFSIRYELTEEVGALKPWGLLDIDDDEVFTERYRARLDKVGVGKLQRVFHAISAKHGGSRLVLLCWETVEHGQPCHRRTWADWWTEQTGQPVPELSWVCGSDGRPVPVRDVTMPLEI
jgi:hypothetical protein